MRVSGDFAWPLHFATKPVVGRTIVLEAGHAFPIQDKAVIRGYGPALGVKDADRRSFAELPYVQTLNVRSEQLRKYILERDLAFEAAKALVEQGILPGAEAEEAE